MKSITYAEKSWLLGDLAADAVVEYAVLLARTGSADSVDVSVLSLDGTAHSLTLVVGPATMMTSAPVDTALEAPNNDDAIALIHERMRIIRTPWEERA